MKKSLAIFFLIVYVMSLTELHQLSKLPLLFQHFTEHKSANNTLTLSDFLVMHYISDFRHPSDHEKDMQLPFKSHDECLSSLQVVYVPANEYQPGLKPVPQIQETFLPYKETFKSYSALSSIWQPPKFC